jgi:hypothetical protein
VRRPAGAAPAAGAHTGRGWTAFARISPRHNGTDAPAKFIEPGRAAFELALALSALALVFPWVVIGALAAAIRARRQGSSRAGRAVVAALWCCLLGIVVRTYLGFGVFP